ncbi:MAG: cation transporter [Deltaproteobacteria bacterium]|nr:cation transporter [Deltaproteobacteria bacterium]
MNPIAFRATLINILGNSGLFVLKLAAGILSGSIALISDALNSLNDIAASIATFICVKISNKHADEGHPFGHSRAEPIAGLIIAVLAGILGFEIIRESIERLLTARKAEISLFTLIVPVVTMVAKAVMSWHFKRVGRLFNSPALLATSLDSLMDVFVSLAVLVGIVGTRLGYLFLDPLAAFVISIWIIRTGYRIGMENIAYLMGQSPEPGLMEEIKKAALSAPGVRAINTVRAHYVGNFIHVEIHVEVDKNLSTQASHDIGKGVEKRVEGIGSLEKAFVHIDPV